jgi:hypothetical protein
MSCGVAGHLWDTGEISKEKRYALRGLPFRQNTFDDVQPFLWILAWVLFRSFMGTPQNATPSTLLQAQTSYNEFYRQPPCMTFWQDAFDLSLYLSAALPDRFRPFIDRMLQFHIDLIKIQKEAFIAAINVDKRTLDIKELACRTPAAIKAGMENILLIKRDVLADDELPAVTFDMVKLVELTK